MADVKQMQFGQRLRRISEKHQQLARGYVTRVAPDGLIIAVPSRKQTRHALRSLLLCLAVMLAFKVFLFAAIGQEAYVNRVLQLQNGSLLDKVGAYVMYPDALTVRLAQVFAA